MADTRRHMTIDGAVEAFAQLLSEPKDENLLEAFEQAVNSYLQEHPEARPEVRAVLARIASQHEQR